MENKPLKSGIDSKYYTLAFKIMFDFEATMAVLAVAGAYLGQYLDDRYNKRPLFLIICLVLSFAISAKVIHGKAKKYGQVFNDIDKK